MVWEIKGGIKGAPDAKGGRSGAGRCGGAGSSGTGASRRVVAKPWGGGTGKVSSCAGRAVSRAPARASVPEGLLSNATSGESRGALLTGSLLIVSLFAASALGCSGLMGARAGGSSTTPPRRRRIANATSSSRELECVFLSPTPNSGSMSRITFGLTSSSRASSLIRILLIVPRLRPAETLLKLLA